MAKIEKSVSINFDNVADLKKVLNDVPDNASIDADTKWVGYGPSERQEFAGLTFTWTEEV